jgi:hypothetical protein
MCNYILPKKKRQCRKKNTPETDFCWLHQENRAHVKKKKKKNIKTCNHILPKLKRQCLNKAKLGTDYCWRHQKSKIPVKKKKREEDVECCVCLEKFQKKDKLKKCKECEHRFHINCIVNWGKAQCPTCRTKLRIPKKYRKKLEEKRQELREYNNPPPQTEPSVFIPTDYNNRPTGAIVVHTPEEIYLLFDEILSQQGRLTRNVISNTFERVGIHNGDFSRFVPLSSLRNDWHSQVEMMEYALSITQ